MALVSLMMVAEGNPIHSIAPSLEDPRFIILVCLHDTLLRLRLASALDITIFDHLALSVSSRD